MKRRLLFVDDEETIRITLAAVLEKHGFEVSTAASVPEALQKISAEKFDVLLSDLNIGNPGDGLTVVSAMRRTQPEAATIILTGYPAFQTALEAIRQQVDDYIVKPANIPLLIRAIESKLASSPRRRPLPPPKRIAMLLQENLERIEELWLSSLEKDGARLQSLPAREQQSEYCRAVLERIIRAAQSYSGEQAENEPSVVRPGSDDLEGHTPRGILAEICLLRRTIAQIVQDSLLEVNLSYLVPDLTRVNEALDEQAQAAMSRFLEDAGMSPK